MEHLVAEEPVIVPLVSNNWERQEIGLVPAVFASHVEVKVMDLVKEKGCIIVTFLGKRVVWKTVPNIEGLNVSVECRFAIVNLRVYILSEELYTWMWLVVDLAYPGYVRVLVWLFWLDFCSHNARKQSDQQD